MRDQPKLLTPKLRFPEFRESWDVKEIGDYLVESRIPGSDGFAAKKITVKLWGKGVYEKVESLKGSENTQYYKRRAGQFIYSKLDFLNQAFGIIPKHLDGFESTVDLPCFDVSNGLDPRFLLEYVQRPSFYKKHGDMADGGRKAKRIQVESFLAFPIAVPFPAEQRKIAACLTSLDELLAAEGRKLEALRDHKKGLMQQLFPRPGESRPRLRFPEFRDAPEWERHRLGALCRFVRGPFGGALKKEIFVPNGYAVYEQSHAIENQMRHFRYFITEEKYKEMKRFAVQPNDLIMSCSGTMGKFAQVPESPVPGVINQALLKLTVQKGWSSQFLLLVLGLPATQSKLLTQAAGGAMQNVVGVPQLKAIELLMPREAEQQRIATCLSSLDAVIAAQSRKLDGLRAHKKGLMQQLFPSPEGDEAMRSLVQPEALRR